MGEVDLSAARGVAIREFPLQSGFGAADYLLYVGGKACGVIEAKKFGTTLTGVELQSSRYSKGMPASLPAWRRPLPFLFESTGEETRFTSLLDPEPRSRNLFAQQRRAWRDPVDLQRVPYVSCSCRRDQSAFSGLCVARRRETRS
jgi:type I restriction enzyme R subunit